MPEKLTVSVGPHISQGLSSQRVMLDVLIGLAPAMAAAVYYFRGNAISLTVVCVAAAMLAEWICNLIRRKPDSLGDLSAMVTGVILAFSLPPSFPLTQAAIGSAFAILIGKMVFGGLGCNIFNPAMVGRAFLTASFGMMMTTWTVPATINAGMPQIGASGTEAITQATPLAWSKQAIKSAENNEDGGVTAAATEQQFKQAFFGEIGGCLGETSTLALLLGGGYLLIRRTISWQIPIAALATAFAIGGISHLVNPDAYASPWFHIAAGGLMLGALFIATDPVTAPLTGKGMLIFGAGVGGITMLIRLVGEYPEGVMYSVLLMNAVTPLIDRFCRVVPYGGEPNA